MMALKRNASMPTPPAFEGGDRVLLDYVKHVQPVFNKHCISCHGQNKPAAGIEFTDRPDAFGFLQSYRSLFGFMYEDKLPVGGDWWYQTYYPEEYEKYAVKGDRAAPEERAKMVKMFDQIINGTYPGQLVKVISRRSDASITQPYQAGSYKSKLIMHLFGDPEHIAVRKKLSPAEWEALVSFVDNNAPATGWFYTKKDKNGMDFKRKINGKNEEDLMRVYIQYSDPWNDRKPNDDNGTPVWPAIPTKVQVVDSARLGVTQLVKK